ncbi:hypothetical protein LCGC14_1258540 [marine sediment metagenome]|uniref:Uncharacterized protein n=1 Tax=marine sediment metagenome TaxID=412755 RepID=A0A0F9L1C7_9ZZZZ
MKRTLFGLLAFVALLALPTTASAQLGIGFGIAAPVGGGSIATGAVVDSAGVVRVNRTLDATPRILIEVHKAYSLPNSEVQVGPAMGIAPIFDTGLSTNIGSERGPGIGFGGLVSLPVGETRRFNIVVLYMVDTPTLRLDGAFRDGFQAPRDFNDQPLDPTFRTQSNRTLVLGFTVSGLF